MAAPNVIIKKGNGTLGGLNGAQDGTSLLVITRPEAYTATETVFLTLKNAEDAGLTEANDLSNDCLVWEHIKDFYQNAPNGTELHVLLLADTVTFTNIFTENNAANTALKSYLASKGGDIKLVGVAINPADAEVGGTGISSDLSTAIPLAHAFAEDEYDRFRPISILLEGRDFTGTIANATNLRTKESGSVSVVIARDDDRESALTTAGHTLAVNYAQLGYFLGVDASLPVQRNPGRVKNGALKGITKPALSGSQLMTSFDEAEIDTLHDKGYIFYRKHAQKDGFFYNSDNTCTSLTDDYKQISRNRVADKASRIARRVYLEELLDEVAIDPETGQLAPIVVQTFQNIMQSAIETEMIATEEIIAVSVFVDPNQNVLETGIIEALIKVTPYGIAEKIEATVEFNNPNE